MQKHKLLVAITVALGIGFIFGWVGRSTLLLSGDIASLSRETNIDDLPANVSPSTPRKSNFRPPNRSPNLEIVGIDAKVTESNDVWWKYAWRLTLRNSGETPISVNATIEFLDKEGFVVDDATGYGMYIEAGEEKTFTGYDLIDVSVAHNIVKVGAKVGQ